MAGSPECSTAITPLPRPPGSEERSERYGSRAAEGRDPMAPLSSRARSPPKKDREDRGRVAIGERERQKHKEREASGGDRGGEKWRVRQGLWEEFCSAGRAPAGRVFL